MAYMIDGKLVKKSHSLTKFGEFEMEEFKRCADPVSGPDYFMNNYYWVQGRDGKTLFNSYGFQDRLIDSYHNHRYSIGLCSRQLGKCLQSTVVIKVRNKTSGKIQKIDIEKFYEMCNDENK